MSVRRRGRGSSSGSIANRITALCQMRSLCDRDFIAQGLGPLMAATTEKFAQKFAMVWSVEVKLHSCQEKKAENGRIKGGLPALVQKGRRPVRPQRRQICAQTTSKSLFKPSRPPTILGSFLSFFCMSTHTS